MPVGRVLNRYYELYQLSGTVMAVVGLFDLMRICSLENIFNPKTSFIGTWDANFKNEVLIRLDLSDEKEARKIQ